MSEAQTNPLGTEIPRIALSAESGGTSSNIFMETSALTSGRDKITVPMGDNMTFSYFLPTDEDDSLIVQMQQLEGTITMRYDTNGKLRHLIAPVSDYRERLETSTLDNMYFISKRHRKPPPLIEIGMDIPGRTAISQIGSTVRSFELLYMSEGEYFKDLIFKSRPNMHIFLIIGLDKSTIIVHSVDKNTSSIFTAHNRIAFRGIPKGTPPQTYVKNLTRELMRT